MASINASETTTIKRENLVRNNKNSSKKDIIRKFYRNFERMYRLLSPLLKPHHFHKHISLEERKRTDAMIETNLVRIIYSILFLFAYFQFSWVIWSSYGEFDYIIIYLSLLRANSSKMSPNFYSVPIGFSGVLPGFFLAPGSGYL